MCMCCRKGASSSPAVQGWRWNWKSMVMAGSTLRTRQGRWRRRSEMNEQLESRQNMELERVSSVLAGHDVPWVINARQSALARFATHGFPTRHEEEWKYTDVSMLAKRATLAPDHIPPDPSSEAALYAWTLSQRGTHLMVFVNGHYSKELSTLGKQ